MRHVPKNIDKIKNVISHKHRIYKGVVFMIMYNIGLSASITV